MKIFGGEHQGSPNIGDSAPLMGGPDGARVVEVVQIVSQVVAPSQELVRGPETVCWIDGDRLGRAYHG